MRLILLIPLTAFEYSLPWASPGPSYSCFPSISLAVLPWSSLESSFSLPFPSMSVSLGLRPGLSALLMSYIPFGTSPPLTVGFDDCVFGHTCPCMPASAIKTAPGIPVSSLVPLRPFSLLCQRNLPTPKLDCVTFYEKPFGGLLLLFRNN